MTIHSQHLPERNSTDTVIDVAPPENSVVAIAAEAMVDSGSKLSFSEPTPVNTSSSGSALVSSRGSFSAFLAPLKKDTFKEVVNDVQKRLEVVNQTLSLLDNLLDAQGFDAILDEMLRSITLKTGELLNADRSTIFLLDEDKQELWSIVAKDEQGNNLELRIPMNAFIAGEVATQKKVVNIPYDFYDDPRSEAAKQFDKKNNYRTYTMLAMPLLNEEGKLVAVAQLINKLKLHANPYESLDEKIDLGGFTPEDERVFREFAPSIRLIIESSRSFYKATQQQRAATALMKATQSLSLSSLDLEETLKRVMNQAKELMQADRSILWLLDTDRDQLWTKIPMGDDLQELRIPMNAGFEGQVATSGRPLLIPFDSYEHPNSLTSKEIDQKTNYRTCSMLCMPVFNAQGELIAVTQLVNKKRQGDYPPYDPATYPEAPEVWRASFNRSDQEFMQAFNIQAGVALQNAKLFETVRQQEQMQRDILRSLTNGVISTDKNGIVIAANESAKALLGFDDSEALEGRPVRDFVLMEKGDFPKWFDMALQAKDEKSRQQYYPDQTLQPVKGLEQHSVNLSINTIIDTNDRTKVSGALVVMDKIGDEKRLKSTMYRYMTQELVDQLLENPNAVKMGGTQSDVTVLISDIHNYSTLTEHLSPKEVVELLNEYFEQMVGAIFDYKGTLDKYIGSKIVSVFGVPLQLSDHQLMAIQAAVKMQENLKIFNSNRLEKEKKSIQINIGISSGSVISGNVGSSKRMEFTSTGIPMDLAAHLQKLAKEYNYSILIDEDTYQACKKQIGVRELETIRTKDRCWSIYELIELDVNSLDTATNKFIRLYQSGRDLYYQRNFKQSIPYFEAAQQIRPKDKTTELFLCRAREYLNNSPPDNWDGFQQLK
jgi:adenylate cyclase